MKTFKEDANYCFSCTLNYSILIDLMINFVIILIIITIIIITTTTSTN
jgi:hypothetical protein